jgi:hypothetical protein
VKRKVGSPLRRHGKTANGEAVCRLVGFRVAPTYSGSSEETGPWELVSGLETEIRMHREVVEKAETELREEVDRGLDR